MYNEKVLNSVLTWLPSFSAKYHNTKEIPRGYFVDFHRSISFLFPHLHIKDPIIIGILSIGIQVFLSISRYSQEDGLF
jgi:hypothetical protein